MKSLTASQIQSLVPDPNGTGGVTAVEIKRVADYLVTADKLVDALFEKAEPKVLSAANKTAAVIRVAEMLQFEVG